MRTLSTCSIFDISLRICCCTFATLRGFAHTMRSGVTAFGCAPFRAACVTRKGAASEGRAHDERGSETEVRPRPRHILVLCIVARPARATAARGSAAALRWLQSAIDCATSMLDRTREIE